MLYSAVIHPFPDPFIKAGTVSSMEAVQITRVLPISISAEPSAVGIKSGTMFTGRIWSGERLSERKKVSLVFNVNQLDVLNRAAQKLLSEPAKFLDRISSIAAQSAGVALYFAADKVFDTASGGFGRIDDLNL